jgi:hypothetical protein
MQDLNELMTGHPNLVLPGAVAINDAGAIVCFGAPAADHTHKVQLDHLSHAGPLHVFLLSPE